MALSQKQAGHLIIFAAICFFSFNIPISKYLLAEGYISAYGLTIARMAFASIAFWAASLFAPKEKIRKKDHLFIFLGGLLGITFNQGLFIFGLANTSPVDASIITTSGPLFAMVIAAIILKEPITPQKVTGVIIGGIGAIFLVYASHHGINSGSSMKGNLAVVCSSLSYATFLVVTKPLSSRYSSITLMKWMFLYSTILLLPLFYKDLVGARVFHQTDIVPYILIGYTLLFATFIAYLLIPIAQQKIRPTTISMYSNLQPLIASIVAVFLGQDTFSLEKIISAILILSGVYLVTQSKSKKELDMEKLATENKA